VRQRLGKLAFCAPRADWNGAETHAPRVLPAEMAPNTEPVERDHLARRRVDFFKAFERVTPAQRSGAGIDRL